MNKIYRLVRNADGHWVAASELAKSRGKRASRVALLPAALLFSLGSWNAFAANSCGDTVITSDSNCQITNLNPFDNDAKKGAIVVGGGATVNMSGALSDFVAGTSDPRGWVTWQSLADQGRIVSGSEYIGATRANLGSQSLNISAPDPITQGKRTVAVYDSSKFSAVAPIQWSDRGASVMSDVNGSQYIDLRLGTVDATGGTLNVALGDKSKSLASASNSATLAVKQSSLVYADGTGSAASQINWDGKAQLSLWALAAPAPSGDGTVDQAATLITKYATKVIDFEGNERPINDVNGLKAYNDFLVSSVQSGALDPSKYQSEFNKAVSTGTKYITISTSPNPNDEVSAPIGAVYAMEAVGANATAHVSKDAYLQVYRGATAVVHAAQGATFVNDGTVGHSGYGLGIVLQLDGKDTKAVNNGVLNASLTQNEDGSVLYDGVGRVIGVQGNAGSTFTNNGVLNVAASTSSDGGASYGINLVGGTAVNNGAINVGVTGTAAGAGIYGVQISSGEMTNSKSGHIYLGRGPQLRADDKVDDVALSTTTSIGVTGIYATSTGKVTNAGTLTFGEHTEGATGIDALNASGHIENSGLIQIKGAVDGLPRQNIGMSSRNSKDVSNTGIIELKGFNAIALQVKADPGKTASIVNSGTIEVAGGKDNNSLRNYGVWAEGANAEAKMTGGAVNLAGDGAIGVHARDQGKITVDGGTVNFVSGGRQVGFFAYGKDSSVNINTAPSDGLDVKTSNSTLFRIEDGATINNKAKAKLIASGPDSTALQVTGKDSKANLANMDVTVSGKGAVALRVEGGAEAEMTGTPSLTLKDGTTAVVVDNKKYDLAGDSTTSAQSIFTNNANVDVLDAKDVTVFVAQNGGKLINAGDIHLSHGTAIEVVGAGSSVAADASGKRGKITVDDGKAGIYVHGGASLTTNDTITVNGDASGVLVGADAGKVTIGKDATIIGKGSKYGNLITNQSVAGNVLVDGATLEMKGAGAALLSENNLDTASYGNVIVSGAGKGIALSKVDGKTTDGSLALGPKWTVDVTGTGAGVYANTAGDLSINGSTINVSGTGNAIKSYAANSVTINDGTKIKGTNAGATLVVGDMTTLTNRGTIQAESAAAKAIALGSGGAAFENVGYGFITGSVNLGDGENTALLADHSVLNGALVSGSGKDTFTVRGNDVAFGVLDGGLGSDDTLIFDGHDYTADANNTNQLRNFEQVNLTNSSTLNLQRDFVLGDNFKGVGMLAIDSSSALVANSGSFAVRGDLANAGRVTLANADGVVGNVFTVTGNYIGSGGTVELNTVLGDDASPTDKLVVQGDTSGRTNLKINGVADTGAYTQADGIEVVQVGGKSEGQFALSGRVVAGAREYLLAQGGKSNPSDGNWYLRSEAPTPVNPVDPVDPVEPVKPVDPVDPVKPIDPVNPVEPVKPVDPVNPIDPVAPVDPVDPAKPVDPVQPAPADDQVPASDPQPAPATPVYRPEPGAYLGNQIAAIGMFQQTMHDRLGEVDFTERQRGDDGDGHKAVWSRVIGRTFDATTGADQIDSATQTAAMQVGGDIGQWTQGDSRTHFGVMGGIGHANTQVDSSVTGYQAKGKVNGYSIGAYGTWFAHASKPTGLYVDSWVQYGWYKNTVQGQYLMGESYNSKNWTASVESGYAFDVGHSANRAWYIEPEVQVIVNSYHAPTHTEANGTQVSVVQGGGITTRLGARFYTRDLDMGQNRVQPFVETNWWHNGQAQAIALNGEKQAAQIAKDIFEVKAGVQAELGKGWTGWGHAGVQMGAGHQRGGEAQLGVKYSW
jgi:outer membrane autotransporter protein